MSRQKRFTAACGNGKRLVILARSVSEVVRYFEREELTLKWVIPGDHRRLSPASGRWRIDDQELRKARRGMKLRYPVRIWFCYQQGPLLGQHRLMEKEGQIYHDIMLKGYMGPTLANDVLWHELRHAWQAEISTPEDWDARHWDEWPIPYEDRPCEIDARNYAWRRKGTKLIKRCSTPQLPAAKTFPMS